MNLGSFNKQPAETLDYDIDYSDWLTPGDNLQHADVVVEPAGVVVDSVFINEPRVKIWLSGGTHGTTCKVTVTLTTADGRVKQDEFKLRVKDI